MIRLLAWGHHAWIVEIVQRVHVFSLQTLVCGDLELAYLNSMLGCEVLLDSHLIDGKILRCSFIEVESLESADCALPRALGQLACISLRRTQDSLMLQQMLRLQGLAT